MTDIKSQILQLIGQGEELLRNLPKKSDYKAMEKSISDKYRSNEPVASIGRELSSMVAGEVVSSIFGTGKKAAKSATSKGLKNNEMMQRDDEIRQLQQQYDLCNKAAELRYRNWSSKAINAIKMTKSSSCLKKFNTSKQKAKLETKLNEGIIALNNALDFLENPPQKIKDTNLIKTGEPLKGRKILKDFMETVRKYIKIQEPHPTPEILEIVESVSVDAKIQLLLGSFKKDKDKEEFEKSLALLRKAGRTIDVVLIDCNQTAPFHDRFLISEKKGITTGTSLSGLGLRDSVITELNDWKDIEKRFDEYVIGPKTKHRGIECKRERL